MKFTLSHLKEYLQTSASLDEICCALTNIGLEVESIDDKAKSLSSFFVAKVVEAKKHENSDKLKICQVELPGKKELTQVICGGINARAGIKIAFADIGSTIPTNKMVIKKAKIAGYESHGMLCSAAELGLDVDDGGGIIEIDEKWPVGAKISEVFSLDEAVIEINVTPNRGDCLGVLGIAKDLAAFGIGALKNPEIKEIESKISSPIKVQNNCLDLCSYGAFRYFKDVKNCQSPKWLKEKLESVGINSISAIVDITNYVMLSLNRPMHAYDASKIQGDLIIRKANNDEKFISLKDDEFILNEDALLIADSEKPLGIAGIIGSKSSACDLSTSEIFLESAFFNATNISKTGRKLNLITDARYRFERGVDDKTCDLGLKMASELILEICGGVASEIIVVGEKNKNKKISFDLKLIKKLIGIEVLEEKIVEILKNLSFGVEKAGQGVLNVEIPSSRSDIKIPQDLVEEVIRIYGYDKINYEKLDFSPIRNSLPIFHKVRFGLANAGMIENINWSFCDVNLAKEFVEIDEELLLQNPISSELNYMRPNLIVGLLESCRKNILRNFNDLSLFEIGKIFLKKDQESLGIAGIRIGKNLQANHYQDQRDFDVFDVKKDVLNVIEILGIKESSLQIETLNPPKHYHPHRFASLKLGKNIIGYFGEIHPSLVKKFDLKNRANIFEIFTDKLPNQKKSPSFKAFIANDLQLVERDFAFLIAKEQEVGKLVKAISNCDKNLIKEVNIFDIYSGKNIDENKKSVALKVVIEPVEKTLTSEEIEVLSQKIIAVALKDCQATLRS